MPKALYPGTFDPVTNGHLDIVARASKLFDELIVAVAESPQKPTLFSLEDRMRFMKEGCQGLRTVRVESFSSLLIDYARAVGAQIIIRGLRAVSDFEYEFQMALMNRTIDPEVETIFMAPADTYTFLSSRIVKEVAAYGGKVEGLVPPIVQQALEQKFPRR
ncbi:MAG: pantetheine-phosphate adenylyltransferase [Candidatus Tectimicrobiota bacterium]